VAHNRNAFISMTQCAEHVQFQLPNEQTRVGYLMDAIGCNDAPLQAAMALVRNDTGPTGKMNNFEDTASFLLPHCPVAKKRIAGSKHDIANISDINATDDKESGRRHPRKVSARLAFISVSMDSRSIRNYRTSRRKSSESTVMLWRAMERVRSYRKATPPNPIPNLQSKLPRLWQRKSISESRTE